MFLITLLTRHRPVSYYTRPQPDADVCKPLCVRVVLCM